MLVYSNMLNMSKLYSFLLALPLYSVATRARRAATANSRHNTISAMRMPMNLPDQWTRSISIV